MVLFHCFDTVFNDEKSGFYAGFEISHANSTVLTGDEQQNLKKHDAWKHPKVKGTHDPTKIRFFVIFFKICKKNQSQKSCKKNQYVTDFFYMQTLEEKTV